MSWTFTKLDLSDFDVSARSTVQYRDGNFSPNSRTDAQSSPRSLSLGLDKDNRLSEPASVGFHKVKMPSSSKFYDLSAELLTIIAGKYTLDASPNQ